MSWDKVYPFFVTLAWINLGAGLAAVVVDGGAAFGAIVTLGIAVPLLPAAIFVGIISEPFIRYEGLLAISIAVLFIAFAARKFSSVIALIIIGAVSVFIAYGTFVPLFTHKMNNAMRVAVEENGFECIIHVKSVGQLLNTRKEKPAFEHAVAIKRRSTYYWSFSENSFVYHSKIRDALWYRYGVKPSCPSN